MRKQIEKCIKGGDYVKVHLTEPKGDYIKHVDGVILEQSTDLILMSDSFDFHYDGLTIIRKRDIRDIQLSDNERFMTMILKAEGYMTHVKKRKKQLGLNIDSLEQALAQLQRSRLPVIIECQYGKLDLFHIGPIVDVTPKRVSIHHFNAKGEYDAKPTITKLKDITTVQIDSPYANTFFKYVRKVD
jgi:hypothetical protein